MSRFGTYKIGGVTYDVDDLSLNEMRGIEELCDDTPFSDLNFGSSKTLIALCFTLLRRTNPDVTLEMAGETKMIELMAPDEEPPPLPPDGGAESQNGSDREGSGAPDSPASIPG